jgi:hypothetical protein
MRQALSLVLTFLLLPRIVAAGPGTAAIATQIVGMPLGANIEVHFKNAPKMRGSRGQVSEAGFVLVDAHASEHQIAFDDVASVKRFSGKSHTTRNILIGVGIAAVAVAVTAGILFRCGGLGCR